MDDVSIFKDKKIVPSKELLADALGKTFTWWSAIQDYVYSQYPGATADWTYPGVKYGWNFRLKDKKRAIIYFLPRNKFFKVAFVFGQKATDIIVKSNISDSIKNELKSAKVYAEGRGIRIDVRNKKDIDDIKILVDIKLSI
jgi:hypothetical protein